MSIGLNIMTNTVAPVASLPLNKTSAKYKTNRTNMVLHVQQTLEDFSLPFKDTGYCLECLTHLITVVHLMILLFRFHRCN